MKLFDERCRFVVVCVESRYVVGYMVMVVEDMEQNDIREMHRDRYGKCSGI